jgi:cell division protein FtsX
VLNAGFKVHGAIERIRENMPRWIEHQKYLVDFMISSLLRRRRKNAALIAVYTLIVFLPASVILYVQAIHSEASIVLQKSPEMIVQKITAGRHDLIPAGYIERIRNIRGVSQVEGRLWGYYYDPIVGANYTVIAATDPESEEGSIVIGEGVARTRLVRAGDDLEFQSYRGEVLHLNIHKTISSDSELISSDLILVSETDFRRLFGMPVGFFTDLALKVRNSKEHQTVAVKIARALPDTRQILRNEVLRTYDAVYSWRSGIVLVICIGAVLAFTILAWDKASGLSSEERKEIGILKAVGWEISDILALKFWEGFAVSFLSFTSGLVLAYVHVRFFSASLFQPVLKGWAVLYPEFRISPTLEPAQIVGLLFLTVIPYTVATIIPSWRAATVDPDSIMR